MKKTATIKFSKSTLKKLDLSDLIRQCQSVLKAQVVMTDSKLSFDCLSHHLPMAITEITNYVLAVLGNGSMKVSEEAKSRVCLDEMLGKVQTDKDAWGKFAQAHDLKKTIKSVSDIWVSNDKDDSIIFRCRSINYYQALAEITKALMGDCGATFVRPMKLRKHRLSLEDRKDIQEIYARTPNRVSHIAALFKVSPTSADAFCISNASLHPELFLTDEEVESYNSVFQKEKRSSRK